MKREAFDKYLKIFYNRYVQVPATEGILHAGNFATRSLVYLSSKEIDGPETYEPFLDRPSIDLKDLASDTTQVKGMKRFCSTLYTI